MSDSAQIGSDSAGVAVQPWIPCNHYKTVEEFEVRMSKGFLRSLPGRWFPGLSSHWLPLFHSNGVDFKVFEITPLLSLSGSRLSESHEQNDFVAFGAWNLDDEPIAVYADSISRDRLIQAFVPNSSRNTRRIMLEYLARRTAISLQASWSGMSSSQLRYDSEFNLLAFKPQSWIRVRASLNGERVSFAFGLGRGVTEKLDGLWRRQIKPSGTALSLNRFYNTPSSLVRIELMRLSVSPASLPAYLKSGSLIDLEIPLSSSVTLRLGEENWLAASLCCCEGSLVLENNSLSPTSLQISEGATPLCIELGSITLDSATCVELEQVGAMVNTEIPLSDMVQLSIRGEKVGRARLVVFEGRFALSIL